MKIRQSLYFTIILAAIFPIIALGIYLIHINSQHIEEIMTENLQIVTDVQLTEIQNFCQQREDDMEIICEIDILKNVVLHNGSSDMENNYLQNYLNNLLATRVENNEFVESITVVDPDLMVVSCSSDSYEPRASELENIESYLKDSDVFFSNILEANTRGNTREVITIVKRIYDHDKFIGYLVEEINTDFFQQLRIDSNLWNNGTLYILDGNNKIITAGDSQEESRHKFVLNSEERQDYNEKWNAIDMEKEPKGQIRYSVAGDDYITYYSVIDHTNWRIMLSINLDSFLKSEEEFRILLLGILAVVVLLILWLTNMITRKLTKPLDSMISILRQIRNQNNYSLRVHLSGKTELSELSDEIDELITFIEREKLYEKEAQRKLKLEASQDPLTKLLNKTKTEVNLRAALKHREELQKEFALIFIDIDDFKNFNTVYGHIVGDHVLQFVSQTIRHSFQGIAGRIGGDEFSLGIYDDEILLHLDNYLSSFIRQLNENFKDSDEHIQIPICCSIGAVVTASSKISYEKLLHKADKAMYIAKKEGKNTYHIDHIP